MDNNIVKSKHRIMWVDSAKGITILLVVLGHCIYLMDEPLNRVILAFHMPLFFFLSGYCYKKTNEKFSRFIIKKSKSLLIPKVVLGTVVLFFAVVENKLVIEKSLNGLINFLESYFIRSDWFLWVLFWVTIIYFFVSKIDYNIYTRIIYIIFDGFIIYMFDTLKVQTDYFIEIIPMGLLFYMIGVTIRDLDLITKMRNLNEKFAITVFLGALAISILVVCSYYNDPVGMFVNYYGNLILFFIGSILGIWIIVNSAIVLEKDVFLQWCGKNSLIIYIFHYRVILFSQYCCSRIFPEIFNNNLLYPFYWIHFLITVILLIPITIMIKKLLSFIKRKNKI